MKDIKIEIQSTGLEIKEGISKNNKPYKLIIQTVYVHQDNEPYPVKSNILLKEGQQAYNKGIYYLGDESIFVDRNGNISISPVLVQKPANTKAA